MLVISIITRGGGLIRTPLPWQVFLTPKYLAIAMEYAMGGDLFGYIIRNSPAGQLPEDHAQALLQQLILGLDFCHRMVSPPPSPSHSHIARGGHGHRKAPAPWVSWLGGILKPAGVGCCCRARGGGGLQSLSVLLL